MLKATYLELVSSINLESGNPLPNPPLGDSENPESAPNSYRSLKRRHCNQSRCDRELAFSIAVMRRKTGAKRVNAPLRWIEPRPPALFDRFPADHFWFRRRRLRERAHKLAGFNCPDENPLSVENWKKYHRGIHERGKTGDNDMLGNPRRLL